MLSWKTHFFFSNSTETLAYKPSKRKAIYSAGLKKEIKTQNRKKNTGIYHRQQ